MELVTKRKKPRFDLCIICQKNIRTEKFNKHAAWKKQIS